MTEEHGELILILSIEGKSNFSVNVTSFVLFCLIHLTPSYYHKSGHFKMKKRFLFFLYGTSILQLLTACFHSLSFIVEQKPSNETEAQLLQLMNTYKIDLGAGFTP